MISTTVIDPNNVNPGLLTMLDTNDDMTSCSSKTYVNLDDSKELLNNHWGGGTLIEERNIPVVFEDIYAAQQQQQQLEFESDNSNSSGGGMIMTTRSGGVRGAKTAAVSPPLASRRPGRRSTTGIKEEDVSPAEREKLMLRRERNKEAAARCRKRKLDQIESLEKQVGEWEERNSALQRELINLRTEHTELQHMLHEHNKICRLQNQMATTATATATPSAVQATHKVQQQQPMVWSSGKEQQPETILRVPHVTAAGATVAAATTTIPTTVNSNSNGDRRRRDNSKVIVKTEGCMLEADPLYVQTGLVGAANHQTTEEFLNHQDTVITTTATDAYIVPTTTTSATIMVSSAPVAPVAVAPVVTAKRSRPSRPATLSLSVGAQNMRSIEGVPIETPTNIFSQLNFEALMDGRTGLTPTNILTPVATIMGSVSGTGALSSLTTPILASPTCSSQQQRSHGMPGPDKNVKLVSL